MNEAEWFGSRLRELRERAGLSRQEIADKASVSVRSVEKWEQGIREPSWSMVLTLCRALGVPCTEFDREPEGDTEKRGPGRPRKAEEGEETTDQAEADQAPAVPKRSASSKGKGKRSK